MIRLMNMNAVFLAATVAAAFANYHIKYEAQRNATTLTKVQSQIMKENEQIRVLDAEWSHLNEPQRLQALAARHLALQPIAARQVVSAGDLSERLRILEAKDSAVPESQKPRVVAATLRLPIDDH